MSELDNCMLPIKGVYALDATNGHSNHSLKVTHLLSLVVVLTQQCSPSGLKCVGPRYRIMPRPLLSKVTSSAPTGRPAYLPTAVPSGNCHSTLLISKVVHNQGLGGTTKSDPDPTSENEMISPVWSV